MGQIQPSSMEASTVRPTSPRPTAKLGECEPSRELGGAPLLVRGVWVVGEADDVHPATGPGDLVDVIEVPDPKSHPLAISKVLADLVAVVLEVTSIWSSMSCDGAVPRGEMSLTGDVHGSVPWPRSTRTGQRCLSDGL